MQPRLRKAALVAHVASAAGWLGAVAAFLALAVTGYVTVDGWTMRAAYTTMEIIGWTALVPLSFLTLLTGVFQGLGTSWGIVRHYWVLIKLLLTAASTAVLLLYMRTLSVLAEAAAQPAAEVSEAGILPSFSPILHSSAALAVLLTALGLSIYKPRGLTGVGMAVSSQRGSPSAGAGR